MVDTKIITITNQKGGCGKSTITMQLAGALGRDGAKVMVVDADRQGTATRWSKTAPEDNPFPAAICGLSDAGGRIDLEIKKYIGIFKYIIIDCPAAYDSDIPASALTVSDLALVPVIPAPADLWSTPDIVKLIKKTQIRNPDLIAYIVPDQVTHTKNSGYATGLLKKLGMNITKSTIGMRVVYRDSQLIGGTVFDFKGSKKVTEKVRKAQDEITALKNEIIKILKSNT